MKNISLSVLLIAAFTSVAMPVQGAFEDYLTQRWYWTEVIIFQRLTVMEFNSTELLTTQTPPEQSVNIHAFRGFANGESNDNPSGRLRLNSATQLMVDRSNFRILPATASSSTGVTSSSTPSGAAPAGLSATDNPSITTSEIEVLNRLHRGVKRFENKLFDLSYQWQKDPPGLAAEAGQLRRARGYRLLLHGRWLQPVPAREEAAPLLIRIGRTMPTGQQLEGGLAMTVGRYLHFRAQLWYQEPNLGQPLMDIPLLPGAALPVNLPFTLNSTPTYMVMDETRRMRSQETHYLDHPKLGVIVRAEPVPSPDDLVSLFEQLQKLQK